MPGWLACHAGTCLTGIAIGLSCHLLATCRPTLGAAGVIEGLLTAVFLCDVVLVRAQVELCMMMPGHTHEDIDAMFRFIADALRAKGLIRTIPEFISATERAFKEQSIHVEQVATVHDFTSWLKLKAASFEHIKTARYFVITQRQTDRETIMWYKPHVGHDHLYPALKDPATEMPLFDMVNGVKRYRTDPAGIELFEEIPTGTPELQEFESERLDVNAVFDVVKEVIAEHPVLFGDNAAAWWKTWAEETPLTVEAASAMHPISFDWPTSAGSWEPPTLDGLNSEYMETITYLNSKGKQSFSIREVQQAAAEQNDPSPELSAGDLLVLKPGEDGGMHRLPFWIAEVAAQVAKDQSSINVLWRSAFTRGQMKDELAGQWLPVCIGADNRRPGQIRYHAYTHKCKVGQRNKRGHGHMAGTVDRSEVLMYFPKLTPKSNHM